MTFQDISSFIDSMRFDFSSQHTDENELERIYRKIETLRKHIQTHDTLMSHCQFMNYDLYKSILFSPAVSHVLQEFHSHKVPRQQYLQFLAITFRLEVIRLTDQQQHGGWY